MCRRIEMNYFPDKVGIDEDLKRHSKEEAFLRNHIEVLKNSDEEYSSIYLDQYHEFLGILLRSKKKLVDTIGR